MKKRFCIIGGRVYDPINGVDGDVMDLWVEDGRVVSREPIDVQCGLQPISDQIDIIDATGKVIMPGGVDIHSHIAGGKVNAGRKLRPDDSRRHPMDRTNVTRSGTGESVPSTFKVAYDYSRLGYTTVMEGASPPLMARHTHEEFDDIPIIDKGGYILMGNNHFILQAIRDREYEKARDYVAWLLNATRGYGIKMVNPGGVENFKYNQNVTDLDDTVIGFDVTPRQILETLSRINGDLGLPHVAHIHGLNLGLNGNAETTIKTFDAMEGREGHFTHLQFMAYGGEMGQSVESGASSVADKINTQPNVTFDIGQIVFCDTTTMTADGPGQHRLHRLTGNRWYNSDVEAEAGGGVTPCIYRRSNPFNGIQWRTGLELALLTNNPWQVCMGTDHPNAGPFTAYPEIMALLMSRDLRMQTFERLSPKAQQGAILPDIRREYSLFEIAVITRAATAKRLGLQNKGHLGVGADADIAVYHDLKDRETMFQKPALVFKGGALVVKEGEIVGHPQGNTLYVSPGYDTTIKPVIQRHFEKCHTVAFDRFAMTDDEVAHGTIIPCRSSNQS